MAPQNRNNTNKWHGFLLITNTTFSLDHESSRSHWQVSDTLSHKLGCSQSAPYRKNNVIVRRTEHGFLSVFSTSLLSNSNHEKGIDDCWSVSNSRLTKSAARWCLKMGMASTISASVLLRKSTDFFVYPLSFKSYSMVWMLLEICIIRVKVAFLGWNLNS